MRRDERKAAVAAYKERAAVAAVYALTCTATGAVWVGGSANLDGLANALFFSLRQGSHPHPALQQAFAQHGEAAFALDVLERLPEEPDAQFRAARLRERAAHWRAQRGANRL